MLRPCWCLLRPRIEESINILPSFVTFPLLQALLSFLLAVTSPHAVYLSLCLFYHLLLHVPLTDRISRMQTLQTCCFSQRSSEERTRYSRISLLMQIFSSLVDSLLLCTSLPSVQLTFFLLISFPISV